MPTAEELRRQREETSSFSRLFDYVRENEAALAAEGRRPVLGGLLSKEPVMGVDTIRYEGIGPMLAGLLEPVARGVDAPRAAAQGLIPAEDMAGEAFGTAGSAMLGGGAMPKPKGALGANTLRGGGMSDPTQTGWTFKDVDRSLKTSKSENRRLAGDTSRVESVPIRQLYATQPTVNPDFATTSSSFGEIPLVVRKNGKMFVQDGHHRLTKQAEGGAQTANVRFIDLDNADTSTPLLDWSPEKTGFVEADQALLDDLFSANASKSAGLLSVASDVADRGDTVLNMLKSGRVDESIGGVLSDKYPDIAVDLFGDPDRGYELSRIVVPEGERNRGVGSKVMRDIVSMADAQGAKVSLTPDSSFGGNKTRLKDFYKRFGFVENKGRNKDFSTRNTMYREPQPQGLLGGAR